VYFPIHRKHSCVTTAGRQLVVLKGMTVICYENRESGGGCVSLLNCSETDSEFQSQCLIFSINGGLSSDL
jgi:hypothetical protein